MADPDEVRVLADGFRAAFAALSREIQRRDLGDGTYQEVHDAEARFDAAMDAYKKAKAK